MADNVAVTAGTGTAIAADDVSSVFFQKIKLDLGTDGVSAPAVAGAGAVGTGVQRITLASDDPAVVDLAAMEVLLGTIDTDTGVIAGDTTSIDTKITACNTGAVVVASGAITETNSASLAVVGGGTEATALRVTLANDSTGVVTVDGTVTAELSATDNAVLDTIASDTTSLDTKVTACNTGAVVLATGTASIGKLASNTGVDIGDVDIKSIIPGTDANNLGKTIDVACGANDVGVMSLAVRDDALTTLTPVDGDYVPLRVNSTGALHVTGGGGGTEYTEDVATANPIVGTATMMERDDALGGLTPAEGDWAALRCDANGALWTHDDALDAVIDGSYLNANLNIAGTDCVGDAGVNAAGVLRVTIATDDEVNNLLGTIDTDTSTIAGDTTSIDTKITACNTGAVVVSSGAITETNSGTIAGDTTSIDGKITACNTGAVVVSSGAVTVSGIVMAYLSATDNAVLDTIDTALDAINTKLATGTVIGDVNLGATDNAVLDSIATNTTRVAITGSGQAKLDHADVTTAQVLVAAVADKKFYITSIILSVASAGSYWIEDDDAAQITCKYTLAANGGLTIAFPIDTPFKSTTANKGLKVKGSAAGVIGCMITYYVLA